MILVDANILVAAASERPERARASAWLEQKLWEEPKVGLPWESLLAFVRVITNPRVQQYPATVQEAWGQVKEWLDCEPVWIPGPTEAHAQVLERLLLATGAGGALVPDAHLAAIAVEHGLTVCSLDADFARFPGVKWLNPLAPK